MEIERGPKAEGNPEDAGSDTREQLGRERARNTELLTLLKYAQADLENYRKRMDKEVREAGEASVRGLVSRLLVVLDELALAVRHAGTSEPKGELKVGVQMVERNLASALESVGVERIECTGRPFDPRMHEAVEKVQGTSHAEDMVVEELRPGYTFRGQVIRPSLVKVELARKGAKEEAKLSE